MNVYFELSYKLKTFLPLNFFISYFLLRDMRSQSMPKSRLNIYRISYNITFTAQNKLRIKLTITESLEYGKLKNHIIFPNIAAIIYVVEMQMTAYFDYLTLNLLWKPGCIILSIDLRKYLKTILHFTFF